MNNVSSSQSLSAVVGGVLTPILKSLLGGSAGVKGYSMERTDPQAMGEEACDIPLERINPDTLLKMIEEFVTREWSELSDSGYMLDEKVDQVLQQLKNNRARIVYDGTSETWSIIPRN